MQITKFPASRHATVIKKTERAGAAPSPFCSFARSTSKGNRTARILDRSPHRAACINAYAGSLPPTGRVETACRFRIIKHIG
jgi:hypothetical protein